VCASEAPSEGERRRGGFALLLVLFLALRLMHLAWFRPLHADVETFFFPFAYLQDLGWQPFLDYWFEYPPLLAYLLVALRLAAVTLCGTGSVAWQAACFLRAVQISSALWEAGTLVLVYLVVRRLRGHDDALKACWVYLALFATAFASASYLDAAPAFFLMAGLALVAAGRAVWSGVVLGLGFMVKVFPAALLPVAVKAAGRWPRRGAVVVAFLLVVALVAAPFLGSGPPWLRCWLESATRRPPWETPWALLEGQYGFGYVGPPASECTPAFFETYGVSEEARDTLFRLPPAVYTRGAPVGKSPERNAALNRALLERNPRHRAVFYGVASHFATDLSFVGPPVQYPGVYLGAGGLLGLLYLAVLARLPARPSAEQRVLVAAFSVVLFFLYAKGWSPQFVAYLIPVLLVACPWKKAAVWCLLLSVTAFLEMPVWAAWVHPAAMLPDAGGLAALDRLLLQVAVLGRTALFVALLASFYRRMFARPSPGGPAQALGISSRNSTQ
jgi:hypothetical protein